MAICSCVAQIADEVDQVGRFVRVHAGGRLVQQQQLADCWPGRGRFPAAAGRHRAGSWRLRRPSLVMSTSSSRRMRLGRGLRLLVPHGGRAHDDAEQPGVQPAVLADQHVFQRGHVGEQADVLERAGDAQRGDLVGRQPGDVLPVEEHAPAGRLVEAGDRVEEGRLARAVRPDQADDRAAWGWLKSTLFTATRPPKRMVMPWARRARSPASARRGRRAVAAAAAGAARLRWLIA